MKTHRILHPKYGLLETIEVTTPPSEKEAAALLEQACARHNFPLPGVCDYAKPPETRNQKPETRNSPL